MRLLARALLLALLTCACTGTTGKLRTRFAHEHACTEDEVRVVERGGTTYAASGCGQTTEYVCPSFASMGDDARACEERGISKKPDSETPPLPGPLDKPVPPGPKQ